MFSLRVLLGFCVIFCHFQPAVAYRSIAYEEKARTSVATEFANIAYALGG